MTRHCRHPLRVLGLVTLALFITVTSAACTADDDAHAPALPTAADGAAGADGAAPAPTTTTPSPTPSSAKPDLPVPPWPDGAREPTAEGLKIAAEYYFDDLVFFMSATGDVARFSEVCPRTLELCYGFLKDTETIHGQGQYVVSEQISLNVDSVAGPIDQHNTYSYAAKGRIGSTTLHGAGGQIMQTFEPYAFTIDAKFQHRDGAWRIVGATVRAR